MRLTFYMVTKYSEPLLYQEREVSVCIFVSSDWKVKCNGEAQQCNMKNPLVLMYLTTEQ